MNASPTPALPSVDRPGIDRAFLHRLRAETAAEHASIETAIDLASALASRESYRALLARFYGFYRPLEPILAAPLPAFPAEMARQRCVKTAWLAQDLAALGTDGQKTDVQALPECDDFPPLSTAGARFGCWYVLEGSTLGGQMIARELATRHGMDAGCGARFFAGYQAENGRMWQGFGTGLLQWLQEASPSAQAAQEAEIVASARATFAAMERWMTGR